MKISSEVKVGIIGILTIAVLIWGINYLKGRNILKSTYTLHAHFENAYGLESSAQVLMNGIKIGYVEEIQLQPDQEIPVAVALSIDKTYPIQEGSVAILHSTDLLGTKAIRIETSGNEAPMNHDDPIRSLVEFDMLSTIQAQLMPAIQQIRNLAVTLDTLAVGVDAFIDADATRETMDHLAEISSTLTASLKPGGSLDRTFRNLESFSGMLKEQEDDVAALTRNLHSISRSIDSAGIDKITSELQAATHQFNLLLEQINSGEGNAGKLVYSDSLYTNLDLLISDLNQLIRDLNEHPENYVHFSLFGNSQKKKR